MRKLLLFLMLLLPLVASAEIVKIDRLYYELDSYSKTAEVSTPDPSGLSSQVYYFGDMAIPAVVKYQGDDYNVTSIGYMAFYSCHDLTSITIPSSVVSIGDWAFTGCDGLTSVHINNIAAWCKIQFGGMFSNPLEFAKHLFLNGEEIRDLIIPAGVDSISDGAFFYCTGLTSVTIPNGVTSIGMLAFDGCSGLTSVMIPNSVTSIGKYAFRGCSSLSSVTIPNSLTLIEKGTFQGCSSLLTVTILNGVTSIRDFAFTDCSRLSTVNIPSSVSNIGESAFQGCSCLTTVAILNSLAIIGSSAFQDCSSLTSVTIPNSLKEIKSSTFQGCSSLATITIPSSVTSIGYSAFRGCTGLTSVHIKSIESWCKIQFKGKDSNPLYYAEHLFLNGEEIRHLVIPGGVESISNCAFYNCKSLASVMIPNSVTSIGEYNQEIKGETNVEIIPVIA